MCSEASASLRTMTEGGGRALPRLLLRAGGVCLGLLLLLPVGGCSTSPKDRAPLSADQLPQVVVLGFDGVDPDRIEALWSQGKLPNLKQLAAEGSFSRLGTTSPPQSPVAWATFATGMSPGEHGIYDFIARDPTSYRPKMGALEYHGPTYDPSGALLTGITGTNLRRGKAFWQVLSEQGVPVEVLNVPYSWPPEPVPHGGVASGLGVPDLRPTNSTSTVFSSDFGAAPPSPGGVRAVPVAWDGRGARLTLEGPRGPAGSRSLVSLAVERRTGQSGLEITSEGVKLVLEQREWSEWQTLRFSADPQRAGSTGAKLVALGRVRLYLDEASDQRLHLYVSAVGAVPSAPFVALSHPPSLAVELETRAGPYNTVGWEEDTSALSAELLPDAAFFDDLMRTMVQRETMTLAALDDTPPALLISVWTGTDRAAHMFWRLTDPGAPRYDAALAERLGDAIDRTYEQMDRTVGRVRAKLPPSALFLVLSDHGFEAFERGLNVNRWLVDQGYLTLKPGGRSLADADWSKSRAYALGTGQIYINLSGREGQGIVPFGEARDDLIVALRDGLLALRDGETKPLSAVLDGASIYSGAATAGAPDLLLGFAPGYQASWATRLGGVPEALFEDNRRKWSGDHASSLAADTEGVLFTNLGQPHPGVSIHNVAPTLMQVFSGEISTKVDFNLSF